jgi:hypothetical protein
MAPAASVSGHDAGELELTVAATGDGEVSVAGRERRASSAGSVPDHEVALMT